MKTVFLEVKYVLLLVIAFVLSFHAAGQAPDLVKSDSIIYPVHKANIGKILFMDHVIPLEMFKESDALSSFVLKEKSDLSIRVFLQNSLTNYLHDLSPQHTAEELTKSGNYQFTFYMDAKKIYVEDLHAGAGSADSKNQRTVFRVPLISSKGEDSWGRFLWDRFLANGGQEAMGEGEHMLKMEIRPYLKLPDLMQGKIIAEGQLKIVVPEKQIKEEQLRIQPIWPLNDWQISNEKFDEALIQELNRKIAVQTFKEITSIVVIKNNKLLVEEYFKGAERKTLHDTRSVGKSFASAISGIAISEGYIKGEKQLLGELYDLKTFQNYSAAKDSIRLEDLLTMSSCFDGSDSNQESPGHEENMYLAQNWVKFTLDLPVDRMKAESKRWDYFTAGVVVLGDVIHRSVPGGLKEYADKKLFKPLGITSYKWQFTPQKVANTAGGIRLRSLDYAKFGQLYKNRGSWNGRQILTKDWVDKSLSQHMRIQEGEYYGYLFWNKTFRVKNTEYEVYYSSGNGGNKIYIFKDQPFVIVITSKAYNTAYGHKQTDRIMQDYLIPALIGL